MAAISRQAFERLEDENRGICQRLADTESELMRKENELKAANTRKAELLNDLCELQRKIKDLKSQLEKAENLEMEARATARDSQQELEHVQATVKDQSIASKASIASLQQEIKSLKAKLSEKEEQYDAVQAKLRMREERLHELELDRTKMGREGTSKISNLTDALSQSKQVNTQLQEENTRLRRNEDELLKKCELLEQRYAELCASGGSTHGNGTHGNGTYVNGLLSKSKPCADREVLCQTPARLRACSTPVKAVVPEQSLLDTLQMENVQLRQDLQCTQVNFQLTCQKSAQFKQELRETQQSLSDLQAELERALNHKEEAERQLEEAKLALVNQSESNLGGKQRWAQVQKEVTSLREQLDLLEQQNRDLHSKLRSETSQAAQARDHVVRVEAKAQALVREKEKVEGDLLEAHDRLIQVSEQLSLQAASSDSQSRREKEAAQSIETYKQKMSAAKLELEKCHLQLGDLQRTNEELQSQVDSMVAVKRTQEARISAVEASNHLLSSTRKDRDLVLSQEIEQLKCTLAQLTDDKQALEQEQAKLLEVQQKSELHIQELNKTNKKLQREASHNWELSKKLQKELEKFETNYLKSEEGLQEKHQQLVKATKETEEAKLELMSTTKAKEMYELEISKLMRRMEELEQADFELNAKLSDVQAEASSAKLGQAVAQERLEEALRRHQGAEGGRLEQAAQVRRLEVATELMEQENMALLSQVTSLSESLAARNTRVEELQSQVSKYELESKDILARVCELEEEHGRCKETREGLQSEVGDLRDSLAAAQERARAGESAISSAKLDLRQAQEYNATLEAVNSGLQQKLQEQYARIDLLESSSGTWEKRLRDVEQLLKVKESMLKDVAEDTEFAATTAREVQASLRGKLDALETKVQELQGVIDEANRDKKDLCEELLQIQSELKNERHSCQVIQQEREALEGKYECATAEIRALKEKVSLLNQDMEETKRELVQEKKRLAEAECDKTTHMTRATQLAEQYELLKDKTLTLLDDSSENRGPKRVKREALAHPKVILKAKPKTALKPIQNVK